MKDWGKQAILDFHQANPLEGYRRQTFMMLDGNFFALSLSSVYCVLREVGEMGRLNSKKSKKRAGFGQPSAGHDHWRVDVSYLKVYRTLYLMCSVLGGCSRSIVHWEMREKMEGTNVEVVLQRVREKCPDAKPRMNTDNGPQFFSCDFKEFIRIAGMTSVKTSPHLSAKQRKVELITVRSNATPSGQSRSDLSRMRVAL
ncbi:Integrase core domain protein [Stieleria neptunia]|uniref:Integrase core domain protein n=1 Tax=Stieleria neptunia TaxID=2527979 RepID=A0A518HQV6_9BACT|nr:DDE-type integrase/transposase/recombinase [Stieleria neptunia]QDV43243.1 Integrase core domain protein [Stieleria neptunia]